MVIKRCGGKLLRASHSTVPTQPVGSAVAEVSIRVSCNVVPRSTRIVTASRKCLLRQCQRYPPSSKVTRKKQVCSRRNANPPTCAIPLEGGKWVKAGCQDVHG